MKKNKGGGKLEDECVVNDCNKWIFFGSIISKGKYNDRILHKGCLTYINNYYNIEQEREGRPSIRILCVETKQCLTQYRYYNHFCSIAVSAKRGDNVVNSVVQPKFGTMYHSKGLWDTFGKDIRPKIVQLEVRKSSIMCLNAFQCFLNL